MGFGRFTLVAHRCHVIADQAWFATFDAIDRDVIDPLAEGAIDREYAYQRMRVAIARRARSMYQCVACGRLYLPDPQGSLHCFVPADDRSSTRLLGDADDGAEAPPRGRPT